MKMLLSIAAVLLLGPSPEVAAQAAAQTNTSTQQHGGELQPPGALQPQRLLAPRITLPLVEPKPLTTDPPALQGGKPAPLGGYDDAARRCESLGDVQRRARCQDGIARETPLRPAIQKP